MSISRADAGMEPVRRFEVFMGAVRRREWSNQAKAAIVAECHLGVESVSAVARRHGLGHSQLFTWRHQLRVLVLETLRHSPFLRTSMSTAEQRFVPVMVAAPGVEARGPECNRRSRSGGKACSTV